MVLSLSTTTSSSEKRSRIQSERSQYCRSKRQKNIYSKNVTGIVLLLAAIINVSSAFSSSRKTIPSRRHQHQQQQQRINKSSLAKSFLPSSSFRQQKHTQKYSETNIVLNATPSPTTTAASAASTLIQSFTSSSPTSLPTTIADLAIQTPPIAYFLALLSAGFGIPVSEDALCVFSGAVVLPSLSFDKQLQLRLLGALYGGVVISDIITFLIGRSLRLGIMNPIRRYLNIGGAKVIQTESCEVLEDGQEVCNIVTENVVDVEELQADEKIVGATGMDGLTDYENDMVRTKIRKRDRIKSKIVNAGDYIGFVTRMSVGVRGPIMLLSGFSGSVKFWKFVVGSAVGACVSLPVQLFLGYFMKDNPGAVVKAIAGISSVAIGVPCVIAVGSWITILVNRVRRRKESDVV